MNALFDDLPLPALDAIQTEAVRDKWPRALAEMVTIATVALKGQAIKDQDAGALARAVVYGWAKYQGGRMFYLPTGDTLDRALRDARLWAEYSGRPEDITRFMRETGLTEQAVYRILAEQRRLYRDKIQGQLL